MGKYLDNTPYIFVIESLLSFHHDQRISWHDQWSWDQVLTHTAKIARWAEAKNLASTAGMFGMELDPKLGACILVGLRILPIQPACLAV